MNYWDNECAGNENLPKIVIFLTIKFIDSGLLGHIYLEVSAVRLLGIPDTASLHVSALHRLGSRWWKAWAQQKWPGAWSVSLPGIKQSWTIHLLYKGNVPRLHTWRPWTWTCGTGTVTLSMLASDSSSLVNMENGTFFPRSLNEPPAHRQNTIDVPPCLPAPLLGNPYLFR